MIIFSLLNYFNPFFTGACHKAKVWQKPEGVTSMLSEITQTWRVWAFPFLGISQLQRALLRHQRQNAPLHFFTLRSCFIPIRSVSLLDRVQIQRRYILKTILVKHLSTSFNSSRHARHGDSSSFLVCLGGLPSFMTRNLGLGKNT